jgi:beta-N-acetylhexosaminidase
VDSHHALPTVDTAMADLEAVDFAPFHALRDLPLGMTAHIDFTAIDPGVPATWSTKIIKTVIRQQIGFDGFLFSDDLSMAALGGPLGERAAKSLAAGCDAVLHCNGDMAEMQAVVAATPHLSDQAFTRWQRVPHPNAEPFDTAMAAAALSRLMAVA